MLRDAYVRAIVVLHFATFDRIRQNRESLARVTVVLPHPRAAFWAEIARETATTSEWVTLQVRVPLVVQAPPGGAKSHRDLPLINRTAFFRIMEGQVIDALNVQRAWPPDLEQWRREDLERSVGDRIHEEDDRLVAGEARRRARRAVLSGCLSEGPRHIREVLAPLVDEASRPSWSAWLRSTAKRLDRQDHGRRRIVDREED